MYIMPSLKRLRLPALCIMIVAAFGTHLAASGVVYEDIPVPGGTAEVARALGIDTVPERGRFVAELSRLVFAGSPGRNSPLRQALPVLRPQSPALTVELVPVPLTAALWSETVFHRQVPPA